LKNNFSFKFESSYFFELLEFMNLPIIGMNEMSRVKSDC